MMLNSLKKIGSGFKAAAVLVSIVAAITASTANGTNSEKADLAVVDPETNVWRVHPSNDEGGYSAFRFGIEGDVRVPADYDGDGIKDIAVWRPANGFWYILSSGNGRILHIQWGMTTPMPTGAIEDVPVPSDFDGDKIDDIAIWRPVDGRWYVLTSKSGFAVSLVVEWGILGDIPVPADYDGDGRADAAVFRSKQDRWYIAQSSNGELCSRFFGNAGDDLLVPADYTGDGRADLAVYRSGIWRLLDSATNELEQFEFGFDDGFPVPADYDGDGTTDFAVYRGGTWYIYDSGIPRLRSIKFGTRKEIPLNSLTVKESIAAIR